MSIHTTGVILQLEIIHDMKNIKFWSGYLWSILATVYTILWNILLELYLKPKRRVKNRHNATSIKHDFDFSKLKVWNYTYWVLDVWELYSNSYISIWNYCSLAWGVEFLCWNHNYNHFSTYIFACVTWIKSKKNIKYKQDAKWWDLEHSIKWPIIVDDDVWIWTWAKIMSWVHIWQWAVIAAWAVVTKDIPPYAIAGWVPAKVIKYRFPEDKIKKLLQIDYSNIPIEKFREIYPETVKEDFNIDYILEKLKE